MRYFELTIKERGGAVLHPSYSGDMGSDPEAFLTRFFGLDEPDVESYEIREVTYCCLCGKRIEGHGHNAAPLADGVCCDECNMTKVIPERIRLSKAYDSERAD